MDLSDVKDKFSTFFSLTSKVFAPYLKLKYLPKEDKTTEDKIYQLLVWIGSWIVVAILYIGFVYLIFYKSEQGQTGQFSDFFNRPPLDIAKDVFNTLKISPYFSLTFLVMVYFAIVFHAEKTFLGERYLHFDLSGLIKSITLGKFNRSSEVEEQDSTQVQIARKNIYGTTSQSSKELISIVSASGWDMFGNPQKKPVPAPPRNLKFWQKILAKIQDPYFDDGYLLPVIAEPFRKVQIILLDPDSDEAKVRAKAYLADGAHKPITNEQAYLDGIRVVIENIKTARKRNKNIELKLVSKTPQWKIAIVEGEAWTQPILDGIRSDHTPLYGFKKSPYSLYHSFWHISERCWHDTNSKAVDLSK